MHITYRPIQLSDYIALTAFINEVSAERTYVRLQGKQFTEEEEKEYVASYLKKIKNKKAVKLLAFDGDQLIGGADVELDEGSASHVGLFGITLKNAYRGKGIGTELMKRTLESAKTTLAGLEIVHLTVFSDNKAAIALYRKFGFTEYGSLPNGVKRNGVYTNQLRMYVAV